MPALDDELLPPLLFSISDATVLVVVIDMLIKFGWFSGGVGTSGEFAVNIFKLIFAWFLNPLSFKYVFISLSVWTIDLFLSYNNDKIYGSFSLFSCYSSIINW